ncbi:hypothetical protein [Rubripirellula obstinata]|uniref:hypothetical protein n=1 Tax=Rubripirellula obstinata TaxID=406547 RepID=UPI001F2D6F48|nr:hypothetical protein [Rubripirellula obstinata]
MNEDHLAATREHQVGATGQASAVQSVTISERKRDAANDLFRFGIFGPNQRHLPTAFGLG